MTTRPPRSRAKTTHGPRHVSQSQSQRQARDCAGSFRNNSGQHGGNSSSCFAHGFLGAANSRKHRVARQLSHFHGAVRPRAQRNDRKNRLAPGYRFRTGRDNLQVLGPAGEQTPRGIVNFPLHPPPELSTHSPPPVLGIALAEVYPWAAQSAGAGVGPRPTCASAALRRRGAGSLFPRSGEPAPP
jgi:hypothetical protein